MKIAILTAYFTPAFLGGGPIRTLAAMISAAGSHHELVVLTNNYDHGQSTPLVGNPDLWYEHESAKVRYLSRGLRGLSRAIYWVAKERPEAVYVNSLFDPRMSIPFQLLTRVLPGSALAIAPRGELDPGALRIKTFKKKAYIRFAKMLGITRFAIWHASSPLELANIESALGHPVRGIVRENDTLLPNTARAPRKGQGHLKIASVARVSPKKGLHKLLTALQHVNLDVSLDIIGPLEDEAYVATCRKLASKVPENVRVRFLGPYEHDELLARLSSYDLMACPTDGENFGHVIAEALSVSVPVFCADVTPWTNVLDSGGGAVLAANSSTEWSQAIEKYGDQGRPSWDNARLRAEGAYNAWKAQTTNPHFFDLLSDSATKL